MPASRRRRAHDRLAALPGVRPVRRPLTNEGGEFDLYYVRTGRKSRHPLVLIPGGPGMASIGHYQRLRRRAVAAGLDVIMIEHRGVGLSRRDDAGADLSPEALTIEAVVDDVAAVLDDARVDSAVVYGTSYGSYLAAGVGAVHPARVHAMILDSPLLNHADIEIVRRALRGLLWDGSDPLAAKVRALEAEAAMTPADAELAATVYGLGGPSLLASHLDLLLDGRPLVWNAMRRVGRRMAQRIVPFHNEADLVGAIGFRELNFAGVPDGLPLDPALAMREHACGDTPFECEPFDLVARMPGFAWPSVVISGGRDLTTPPAVADRIAGLIPHSQLVRLPTAGHSVLDTREQAALRIAVAVCAGRTDTLAARGDELDALPATPAVRLAGAALAAAARIEAVLPRRLTS